MKKPAGLLLPGVHQKWQVPIIPELSTATLRSSPLSTFSFSVKTSSTLVAQSGVFQSPMIPKKNCKHFSLWKYRLQTIHRYCASKEVESQQGVRFIWQDDAMNARSTCAQKTRILRLLLWQFSKHKDCSRPRISHNISAKTERLHPVIPIMVKHWATNE